MRKRDIKKMLDMTIESINSITLGEIKNDKNKEVLEKIYKLKVHIDDMIKIINTKNFIYLSKEQNGRR